MVFFCYSSTFRYTKTVVDSSLTAQRYNPEFSVPVTTSTTASYGNANTNELIDQLRHINQVSCSERVRPSETLDYYAQQRIVRRRYNASPAELRDAHGPQIASYTIRLHRS